MLFVNILWNARKFKKKLKIEWEEITRNTFPLFTKFPIVYQVHLFILNFNLGVHSEENENVQF